ncbi:amidohydrolase family protein [Cupriavidus alkaliphilus]|uniref:amidohydrolase family protein n=1 Tax=Cupriavidus alkaliphilus TaxID=942866 RepID=UPI001802B7B4|nr:amidohydrolase family protein [Cupriavidus alkaliphilus]MBB3014149.1 putative TIM-barrel fold metal-dependent hydrolase [Cupriavidus alkaliphilus]
MKPTSDARDPTGTSMSREAVDPGLPIVDSHHHLWHPHANRYLVDAFQADIDKSGHRVVASVYVEAAAMHRQHGPEAMRPVGEAEFVAGMAAMSASGAFGPTRCCEAFVGAADLRLGDGVDEVLDALDTASGGRLRGIRGTAIWDADVSVNSGTRPFAPRGLLLDPRFRAGVARLAERKLVYDAWQYYPQLPELCALADALPTATLVVNHCGGLLGVGPYANPENYANWKRMVAAAARRPNVLMKLGGLAGRRTGFGYEGRLTPPTLGELVADWRPYIETCIELFGAHRCMFESNFPVDQIAGDYQMIWNVFKMITANCSPEEKARLFSETARNTYRMS